MLTKDMRQILQIEFKNCIFSAFEGKFPNRHPHLLMAKNLWCLTKASKQEKLEE